MEAEDWDLETPAPTQQQRRIGMKIWRIGGKKRKEGNERRKSSTIVTTTRKTTTTENWDHEFQFGDSPARSMRNRHPQHSVHQHSFNEKGDSDDDDEAGFNFHGSDKDEDDKSVTARSRRAALSRLVSNSSSSSPPPVPPLPFSLLPIPPQHSASSDHDHEHVFSHSPVFSVPPRLIRVEQTEIETPSQLPRIIHTVRTTPRHICVRLSPVLLPEAEGRRVGRKSVESGLPSLPDLPSLPSSPPPHQSHSQAQATPAREAPLLARVGGVRRKWAVRRKRASSAPSEVEVEGTGFGMEATIASTSRANWFFCALSGEGSTNSNSKIMENEYSTKYDAHQAPKASRTTVLYTSSINPPNFPPSMPSTPVL
ncbi:hypothetical protein F5876DRAFT_80344 [Lentinula aff. lateritia]|uniref:Uncharacterized protein n=1 Tax=Lentinula aff. lateritia TaxID=2804960 RepID=A0ACC1TPV0_9AGAR|nr:hypothetical protein F5876DRAFT_80344 [Lentinula aff. lateritia]